MDHTSEDDVGRETPRPRLRPRGHCDVQRSTAGRRQRFEGSSPLWAEQAARRQLGGAPCNFAFHCLQLGHAGTIVSRIGTDPLGRELRPSPTRATKDGTFLDEMVKAGLLAAIGKSEPVDGTGEPEPFRTRYTLTALGRHAAEYGEYDRPYTPGDAPVTGTAAAVLESLAARKVWGRPADLPSAEPGGKPGAARKPRPKR